MDEIQQAAARPLLRASKTTQGLVVAYHFLIAAIISGALILDWMVAKSSDGDLFVLKAISFIAAPLVLLYFATAWGILTWRNWSRTVSLVLNWLNVVLTVVNLAR